MIKLTECPRDAMQGITEFIPTELKIQYINSLLKVGFDVIDFGSFVSSKAIPQMRDTIDVLKKLDLRDSYSQLLAIVANMRGADEASLFEEIDYLGFPFSISEEFQKRNTNSTRQQSLIRVDEISNLCASRNKEIILYLSMAFGNPYNEPWDIDIVSSWIEKLSENGIHNIALSDTIGSSTPDSIKLLFETLTKEFPFIEFGAHIHSTKETTLEKISAAYESGCVSFDSAMMGFGGCPMAKDELTGNIATEILLDYLKAKDELPELDEDALIKSQIIAKRIFHHLK
ncbi:MAG TPA: hydroxymethylglutaryl-CoA lyase [Candidatus Kapabacteria bacterium]|nr:hydroxymethylglutaryl-CoA lyase [Candidatus Kapabacteria bacterium]